MIFNKKGQSALEYLMTYGWALVVIVVVVAALVLLVGNPAEAGDICNGPGSGLNVTNQELITGTVNGVAGGGWQLRVSNISGRTINFDTATPTGLGPEDFTIRMDPVIGNLGTSTGWDANMTMSDPDYILPPGSQTNIYVTHSRIAGVEQTSALAPGTRYRSDFNVAYYDGDFRRVAVFTCNGNA